MNHSQIVSFLWGVADLIRDTFKRGKYQDVILPLTVLRRLDYVLAPTKAEVLATQARYKGELGNLDGLLCRASSFAFYNTSPYDFGKTPRRCSRSREEPARLHRPGFSPNMREVLEKFDFDNTISKLDESGLLFQVLAAVRRPESQPPPGRDRQLHDGHDLRGTHPQVQRGAERKPRRALHAPGTWFISWWT